LLPVHRINLCDRKASLNQFFSFAFWQGLSAVSRISHNSIHLVADDARFFSACLAHYTTVEVRGNGRVWNFVTAMWAIL